MPDLRNRLSPNVLGQLLVMQTIIGSLPDEVSIFEFICSGLTDVPGVQHVSIQQKGTPNDEKNRTLCLPIRVEGYPDRDLCLHLSNPEEFQPYSQYLDNFCFMLNVLLEERNQRKLNLKHKENLERRVEQRTRALEIEVNQRKLAEAALRDSVRLFQSTFENASIGMCLTDPDGTLTMVNPAMAQMLGYTVEELHGQKFSDFTHKDDLQLSYSQVQLLLTGKKSSTTFEKRYLHKSGKTIWAKVGTVLLCDDNNAPQYFITHLENITSKKKAEAERLALEEHLRQSRKMEAIGTLAGGIAHDFNNLLSIIIGYTEMGLLSTDNQVVLREHLEEVLKASGRAKELVTQILAFSRKKPISQAPIEIHTVIEDSLKLIRATIPTSVIIENDIVDCGYIIGDTSQIGQILMNLCTNSAQAMEEKGGRLEIKLFKKKLTEPGIYQSRQIEPGEYVCLSVSDNGPGIEKNNIDRIFDPYFTTKEVGKGSGMGLSVVMGAVNSHHGFLELESTPGKGSTFSIYFPKADIPEEKGFESDRQKLQHLLPKGDEKILVVDDEAHQVQLSKTRLELLGYRVTTTTSAVDALEIFTSNPEGFDLVITDQTMPMMTGDKLSQALLAKRPSLPIIICTGYSSTLDARKASAMHIAAYLMKPVENRILATTVRRVLDDYASNHH